MKRSLIITLLLLATTAYADDWRSVNQITYAWDTAPKIADSDVIKYQPWLKDKSGILVKSGGEILETQHTATFTQEGRFRLCAQTVRYIQGEADPEVSEISCSDVAEYCANGETFGVRYFQKPNRPGGLR
jgi:hypothetical protein